MKIKTMTINAIVAALYVALGLIVAPLSFGALQFRVPEMFNHLIVFNRKYFWGIIIGVFMTNLFFSVLGWYDLLFGVGQSVLTLMIMLGIMKHIENILVRMILNTILFSFTMALIAWELVIVFDLPFFYTWLTTAAGELVVMGIGIPIMWFINKRLDFRKMMA